MPDTAPAPRKSESITHTPSTVGTSTALANPHSGSEITALFKTDSPVAAEHTALVPGTTLISSRPEWQAITASLEAMLKDFKIWAPQHGLKEKSKSPHLLQSTLQQRLRKGVMSRREVWLERLGAHQQANEACKIAVDWRFERVKDTFELSLELWGDVLFVTPVDAVTQETVDPASLLGDRGPDEAMSDLSDRWTMLDLGDEEIDETPAGYEDGLIVQDLESQLTTFRGKRMLSWWSVRVG